MDKNKKTFQVPTLLAFAVLFNVNLGFYVQSGTEQGCLLSLRQLLQ